MKRQPLDYKWKGKIYQIPFRDSQKSRIYESERVAAHPSFFVSVGDGSIQAVEAYVRKVERRSVWRRVCEWSGRPIRPVTVKAGSGARAWPIAWKITLPRSMRSEIVILHELAHIAAGPGIGHHWPFAAAFLALVRNVMGARSGAALEAAFIFRRVRFRAPRKFSVAALAALRARGRELAAARALAARTVSNQDQQSENSP